MSDNSCSLSKHLLSRIITSYVIVEHQIYIVSAHVVKEGKGGKENIKFVPA